MRARASAMELGRQRDELLGRAQAVRRLTLRAVVGSRNSFFGFGRQSALREQLVKVTRATGVMI